MKRNVVLITNCGNDFTSQGTSGEVKTDRAQNTFDVLRLGLDDIDLAIVDLGANTQSLAIVEALTHTKPAPPVIALVDGKGRPGSYARASSTWSSGLPEKAFLRRRAGQVD